MEPCDKETKPAAFWVESAPEMLQKELANEKIHYIYIENQIQMLLTEVTC